jgi:hypothetical protein
MLEEKESHEDEIARHERDDAAEEKAEYGEKGDSDYESGELDSEGEPKVYSDDDDEDEGVWGTRCGEPATSR